MTFGFSPRWREELVVSSERGSFALEMTMGTTCVYLPTAERWLIVGPQWARSSWDELHEQLILWCEQEKIPLRIESAAVVYPVA